MKKLLQSLFILMFVAVTAMAQDRTITGTVTSSDDKLPIPGVSVKVKGTSVGVSTGADGTYSLKLPSGSNTIVFSSLGYAQREISVGTSSVVNASLASDARQLGEVVVTGALGIKRQAKEIGYSTTTVSAKDLTATNVTNVANGLTAKVAGLQVNTINNGINPEVRITLRGARSINGNNNALIVLDGVPIPGGTLNSINPNDVEDVTVLKGSSASALYGSEASNGALIITTKRGSAANKPKITYANSFQLQKVAYFPEIQTKFGPYGGETVADGFRDPETGFPLFTGYENQLYGPAYNGAQYQLGAPLANGEKNIITYSPRDKSPIEAFFKTGLTEQNDLSYQSGDADNNFYFSAQNVYTKGVIPDDLSKRTSLRASGTKTYGIFRLDYSVGYTNGNTSTYGVNYSTNATTQILYANLFQMPAFINIDDLAEGDNSKFYNPNDYYSAYNVNPYWQIKNSRKNNKSDTFLGNISLNIKPTKWFDATYRLSQNFGINNLKYTRKEVQFSAYAASDPLGVSNIPSRYGAARKSPGFVQDYTQYGDGTTNFSATNGQGSSRLQQDVFLKFNHTFFDDFKTDLLIGNTIWQSKARIQNDQSANLLIPDFYNIGLISGAPTVSQSEYFIRQIGVYGALNIGYKDFAFIQATGRNDWDSRLSKTKRSLFYPSISGSFVFTNAFEALKNNRILSYGKLRAAVSKVGQVSVAPYSINNTFTSSTGFPYGGLGGLTLGTTNNNPLLEPEFITEKEFAVELGLLDNRINLSATYYKQNSKNQTLNVQTSASTGFNAATINAGEIENNGYEFELNGTVLSASKNAVGLKLGGNLGIYDSEVVSLLPGSSQFQVSGATGSVYAVVGQPYPSLLGTDYKRDDQGRVIVDATGTTAGYPQLGTTLTNFGRTTPKYVLGLNMSATYKFITFSAVAEYKSGYVIYNAIGSTLDFGGISATSASADRQRFIYPNSVIQTSPGVYVPNTTVPVVDGNYGFWQGSNYGAALTPFVNNAAFWKIREMTLNFNLTQFVNKTKAIKGLNFALTGRNLFLFRPKDNPYADPEYNLDASNAVGVTNANQTPPTRIFGANLQITF
ncbi:SusC/RagA family TonB-linked outer membrane protein [Pedobacter jejuensis]|uniref:SusC/RagA family TonB-linked outer membrane protein n=1 Tax=Pedobacter jejuensis TaxID=1268550 RepID=A0A3N0BP26_9SPHI|nr:SusC/RagA family TonB-linked outer membrane protein [Pedobacter jejuensis]RNL50549.1 SusC/RagA family TonB-linked outer membrane protein [Pedobacter jejuensis]